MGRGRVQLKRIENKTSRQVTFTKRRTGLLKKANEISVLCDVEVALIVFTTKGKLFEYSTDASMETILERHERYSCAEKMLIAPDTQTQGSWTLESSKLMAKIEVLEKNIRHYVGQDLDPLSLRELRSVEQQLENALKRIRTRKNQLMHESISELHEKEKALLEQNNSLSKKLKEKEKNIVEHVQQKDQLDLAALLPQPPPLPLHSFPNLTIGSLFQPSGSTIIEEDDVQAHPNSTVLMPPWMLRHINQ